LKGGRAKEASRIGKCSAGGTSETTTHLLRQKTAKTDALLLATDHTVSSAAPVSHSFSQLVRNISTAENFEFSV
jgi:hypothetical protein